jgi:prepilin-type N-terminal cleavage/methylation domain-containing protein
MAIRYGQNARLLGRRVRRVGDGCVSLARFPPHRRERGFTLIELLATFGLIAVVFAIAIPRMPRGAYTLWTAQTQLLGDMREARASALTKGDHFRIDITGTTTYTLSRMQLDAGGNWIPRTPVLKNVTLPPGIIFSSGTGLFFEFNTRGLMINPSWAATLFLYDNNHGLTRVVTVWPSGQVAPG